MQGIWKTYFMMDYFYSIKLLLIDGALNDKMEYSRKISFFSLISKLKMLWKLFFSTLFLIREFLFE